MHGPADARRVCEDVLLVELRTPYRPDRALEPEPDGIGGGLGQAEAAFTRRWRGRWNGAAPPLVTQFNLRAATLTKAIGVGPYFQGLGDRA